MWEARRRKQTLSDIPDVKGPSEIKGVDQSGNRIEVHFLQMADGPKVVTIWLWFDQATNDLSVLKDDVIKRYGTPSQEFLGTLGLYWCDFRQRSACSLLRSEDAPVLKYVDLPSYYLTITDLSGMEAKRRADLEALFRAPDPTRQRGLLGS
jgi:hypothetical protein